MPIAESAIYLSRFIGDFAYECQALDESVPLASIARSLLDRQPRNAANRGLLISFRFTIDGRYFTIYRTLIPPLSIASRFYALLLLCILSPQFSLRRSFDWIPEDLSCFQRDVEQTVCTFYRDFLSSDSLSQLRSNVSRVQSDHRQSFIGNEGKNVTI